MAPELEHARPHTPQWSGSVLRFRSQPLSGLLSQSANPLSQDSTLHSPATQVPVAFAGSQALSQNPQSEREVWVFVLQPVPSQSAKPVGHDESSHWPPLHVQFPVELKQSFVQAPQARGSASVLVSQPVESSPSQLV